MNQNAALTYKKKNVEEVKRYERSSDTVQPLSNCNSIKK